MAGAVEMCSGLGACRKTLDGTMCPSYMATREEAHSTRGRANVLRLAMAGRLGEAGLGDEGVREVLDLCLECRACKAECPVGVDVARFKSEFLADYWRRHGTPLRARVLGHVHDAVALGQPARAAVELRSRAARPARWLNERLLGLDRRRVPPAWAAHDLRAAVSAPSARGRRTIRRQAPWRSSTTRSPTTTTRRSAWRACEVLERAGFDVELAPNVCCGRPLISQGLLATARRLADVEHRARCIPLAERGAPLVFFEPSCLSAIREDVPALLRGDAQRRAQRVADARVLFEEFLENDCQAGRGAARLWARGRRRSSCTATVIRRRWACWRRQRRCSARIPGATVVDLDAGCCGMAGSFGYAREHFEVSRAIGERRLLPAAREPRPGRGPGRRAASRAGIRSPTSPAPGAASRRSCFVRCCREEPA